MLWLDPPTNPLVPPNASEISCGPSKRTATATCKAYPGDSVPAYRADSFISSL